MAANSNATNNNNNATSATTINQKPVAGSAAAVRSASSCSSGAQLRAHSRCALRLKHIAMLASGALLVALAARLAAAQNLTTAPQDEATTIAPVSAPETAATSKLRPVNFTLVDELFEASLPEDEVVRRWRFMDTQLQDGMKAILKMIFPQIVAISQDAKVSGDCSGGILKWILNLRNLRSWAIKMLDATGKPSAGVFEGSLTMFGNYRQCLAVRAPDEDEIEITEQFEEYFRGQFCMLHLKPWMPPKRAFYHLNASIESLARPPGSFKYYEKSLYDELAEIAIAFNFVDIRMDLCVPSTCTLADIQRVAELLSKKLEMRAKVMRCDIAPRDQRALAYRLDAQALGWLALPIALLAITALAGACLSLVRLRDARRRSSVKISTKSSLSLSSTASSASLAARAPSCFRRLLECMAPFCMTPKSAAVGAVACAPIYGVRNLLVLWFIVVQMTVELKYQYLRESLNLRHMVLSQWPMQFIVNSTWLFESLIILTAFTFAYASYGGRSAQLVARALDKYARLVPVVVTLIAITIITPLVQVDSPVWRQYVEQPAQVCRATGPINLLFLQNFISYDKICLPHTWLLCVELQLIALSLPLLLAFKRRSLPQSQQHQQQQQQRSYSPHKRQDLALPAYEAHKPQDQSSPLVAALNRVLFTRAGLIASSLACAGFASNFALVYAHKLPASWFYTFPDQAQKSLYFGLYLSKTWTHLGAFVVAMLGGLVCRAALDETKRQQQQQQHQLKASHNEQQQQDSPAMSSSRTTPSTPRLNASNSASTIMAADMASQHTSDSGVGEPPVHVMTRKATDVVVADNDDAEAGRATDTGEQGANAQPGWARAACYLAAAACMAAVIFSTYTWSTGEPAPSRLVAAAYDAGARFVWSISLVTIACLLCTEHSAAAPKTLSNKSRPSALCNFLAHPINVQLGKLSVLVYLLSPYVNTIVLAVEEQALFPSLYMIFHVILGNIVITYTLAYLIANVIEQPLRRLLGEFVLGFVEHNHERDDKDDAQYNDDQDDELDEEEEHNFDYDVELNHSIAQHHAATISAPNSACTTPSVSMHR